VFGGFFVEALVGGLWDWGVGFFCWDGAVGSWGGSNGTANPLKE